MSRYGYRGPERYRPLSPWAYFGYTLLFNIPLIGFICLIVYSISSYNINRRSFARSYWCMLVVVLLIVVLCLAVYMYVDKIDSQEAISRFSQKGRMALEMLSPAGEPRTVVPVATAPVATLPVATVAP